MDNETLASELLHEIKMNAKRWFIAFCAMAAIELGTVVGFLYYISLPTEDTQTVETVKIENDDGNANYVGGDVKGGIYNGTNNGSEENTESDTE